MKFPVKYFLFLTVIVTVFVLGSLWFMHNYPEVRTPTYLPLTVAVLYLLTFLSHMFVRVSSLTRGKPFVQLITMSMVLRITIYGLFTLLIIIFHPGNPATDIIYFALLYLILTVFELMDVVRNPIKNQPPKSGEIKK